MSDSHDITTRVHDAIHMNVDLMEGPPRIVERALEVAGQVRRRRRRRRALAGALLITATVGALAGVAAATRGDDGGVTASAGSSTTQSPPTTVLGTTVPAPSVPVWDAKVTRDEAIAIGRATAIDPNTAIVETKLMSWAELRDGGGVRGSSPTDAPDRRFWVISISGPVHPAHCCISKHEPAFRWGVVLIDAAGGDGTTFDAGTTGEIAPWFAGLPDHGA